MKYTRLNISDKKLTRHDFLEQPRKLFILPDNLPDYRLPRNKLYDTQHRGGLAECMRPNLIGGTARNPIYDVNVVGIPTVSFDTKEALSIKHIAEGFANIYRLINTDEYDEIVVPYKDGKPAFGGGVAGVLPNLIKNSIEEEFDRLEKFLATKVIPDNFPEELRKAYVEGPLANKATVLERFNTYLNNRFPIVALAVQHPLALVSGLCVYTAFAGTLSAIPLTLSAVAAGALSIALYQIITSGFFGWNKVDLKLSKQGKVFPTLRSWGGGISRFFGIKAPYKPTLKEVESGLKKAFGNFFTQQQDQTESGYNDEITALAKYNTKKLILSNADVAFYEADIQRVKCKDYDVDAQVAEFQRKRLA